MSHETDLAITVAGEEMLANSGPDTASVLREREQELDEREDDLHARDRDRDERRQERSEREQELDDRRRKLVERWANVDDGGQSLRAQSESLDLRRQDLGTRRDDFTARENDLADKRRQLDEVHAHALHASIMTLEEENAALRAQLSADINHYNLKYDGFLTELEQHVQLEGQWLSEMAKWVADRRQHNRDVNQRNVEKARIVADLRVLSSQRAQLMRDIKEFIGPYKVNETIRREMTTQMNQSLWRSEDQILVGIQFELLCVDVLRAMSFRVNHEGGTDDRGIDIRAEETARSGEAFRYVIQCKYKGKDGTVGRTVIAQLVGDLPADVKYDKAVVMTAGRFEPEAAEHAAQKGISMWDGVWLCQHLIDEEIGFNVKFSTAGYDIQFDSDYWDDLLKRAKAELEKQKRKKS